MQRGDTLMARFVGELPDDLIKVFQQLEINTEKMLGDMVTAGAEVTRRNVNQNMPASLKESLSRGDAVRLTKVYKTPTDDGINCQVYIDGYFINENGKKTPAPLVANMFEYGSPFRKYPKHPFLRRSFRKAQIEKAMLDVQKKYIKED